MIPDTLALLWRKREYRVVVWVHLAALVVSAAGCSADKSSSLFEDLFEPWVRPSPKEAAVDLFDPIDADKQHRAISQIAASPYGGEAPYLKVYRRLLGRTEDGEPIDPDDDPIVLAAAIKALGMHGDAGDVEFIAPLLGDRTSFFVRWEAAKALQRIHNPAAIDPLVGALVSDTDLDVRIAAATALGQYPQRSVFDALVGALSDHDFGVVNAAYQSLRTLTGYDYGKDGADWLAWAGKHRAKLFAYREPYGFYPYRDPLNLLERLWSFWRRREPVAPVRPIGLQVAGSE